MSSISKYDFLFIPDGYGKYKVIYSTSPSKSWMAVIQNTEMTDAVKFEDHPTAKSLNALKKYIMRYGSRFDLMKTQL